MTLWFIDTDLIDPIWLIIGCVVMFILSGIGLIALASIDTLWDGDAEDGD